jgi:hypothetical protein
VEEGKRSKTKFKKPKQNRLALSGHRPDKQNKKDHQALARGLMDFMILNPFCVASSGLFSREV